MVLRVGQTAEKESWQCRGDRQTTRVRKAGGVEVTGKPLRKKAGDVEATGKPPE